MKTLENLTKGNLLVAVKNDGENMVVAVSNAKAIGAILAVWAYASTPAVAELDNIRVVEMKGSHAHKLCKTVKSAAEAVSYKADAEELKKLSEVLADENNLFDVAGILEGTDMGKRAVYVVAQEDAFGLVKTSVGRKSAVVEKIKANGYEILGSFNVDNAVAFAPVTFTGDGEEDALNVIPVSTEVKDYVLTLVPAKKTKEETAEEAENTEAPAEAAE